MDIRDFIDRGQAAQRAVDEIIRGRRAARGARRTCVVCGCDDDHACRGPLGPCSWVTLRPALCSGCVLFLVNVRDPRRVAAILEACGEKGAAADVQRYTSGAWLDVSPPSDGGASRAQPAAAAASPPKRRRRNGRNPGGA